MKNYLDYILKIDKIIHHLAHWVPILIKSSILVEDIVSCFNWIESTCQDR